MGKILHTVYLDSYPETVHTTEKDRPLAGLTNQCSVSSNF